MRFVLILILVLTSTPVFAKNYTKDANCLVAYLLTEGSGTSAADSSGNGNTGTFTSSGHPAWDISYPFYKYGGNAAGDVSFAAASTDNIHGAAGNSTILTMTGAFSFVGWIYPTSTTGTITIYQKRHVGTGQLNSHIANTYAISIYRDTDNFDFARISSNNILTVNTWQHVCITGDASATAANHHIYVNGAEVSYVTTTNGTGGNTATTDTTGSLYVGNAVSASEPINGKMADVGIFNRQITATECQNIYYHGLNGNGDGNMFKNF